MVGRIWRSAWWPVWRSATCATFVAALACNAQVTGLPKAPKDGLGILFIGNSLTYWNSMPLMVQALADSAGGDRWGVGSVAYPDFGLPEHWQQGDAERAIRAGGWDVVVLQQGPSSRDDSRQLLVEYTRRYAELIRRAGGEPGLYAVWPHATRAQDFDRAGESYAIAAADVNGTLYPVGEAWRAVWRRDADFPLYSPDGLHPTVEGSYLAALVIYSRVAQRSPIGLPAGLRLRSGASFTLSAVNARLLQEAAAEAIEAIGKQ
jgi:hypothetical protein